MRDNQKHEPTLVIFDGVCGFCNRFVRFALKRDRTKTLRFASNSTKIAQRLLAEHGLTGADAETVVVIVDGKALVRSDAALFVFEKLSFPFSFAKVLMVVPKAIRDSVYTFMSRHRMRLCGKVTECELIPQEMRDRIVEE